MFPFSKGSIPWTLIARVFEGFDPHNPGFAPKHVSLRVHDPLHMTSFCSLRGLRFVHKLAGSRRSAATKLCLIRWPSGWMSWYRWCSEVLKRPKQWSPWSHSAARSGETPQVAATSVLAGSLYRRPGAGGGGGRCGGRGGGFCSENTS